MAKAGADCGWEDRGLELSTARFRGFGPPRSLVSSADSDADFRRFRARDKDASPFGPVGGSGHSHMEFRPHLSFGQ
eukprot:6056915-Alexandrium_andersonii.AAC.1